MPSASVIVRVTGGGALASAAATGGHRVAVTRRAVPGRPGGNGGRCGMPGRCGYCPGRGGMPGCCGRTGCDGSGRGPPIGGGRGATTDTPGRGGPGGRGAGGPAGACAWACPLARRRRTAAAGGPPAARDSGAGRGA